VTINAAAARAVGGGAIANNISASATQL